MSAPSSLAPLAQRRTLRASARALARVLAVSALASCLAVLSLTPGCARDGRYELLGLDGIDASRLDAGRTIELVGSGFPVGRDVDVALRGLLHGPLGARHRVAHTLRGRTLTPERLEISVTDDDVRAVGGRGTFVGLVEVVVHGASLDGLEARVVGVLDDVTLDVVPSERRASRARPLDGLPLERVLGLSVGGLSAGDHTAAPGDGEDLDDDGETLAEDDQDAEGILVAAVDGTGAAARLGLVPAGLDRGARILALDGMRLLDARELVVDERASRTTLELRAADGRRRVVVVDLDAARERRPDRTTRYDQLTVIVLFAAFLFGAWPWSRRAGPERTAPTPEARPHAAIVTGVLALTVVLFASTLSLGDAERTIPLWLGLALFLRASATLAVSAEPAAAPTSWLRLGGLSVGLRHLVRRESWTALASALATTVALGVFLTARGSAESASLPALGGPLASAPWMPMSWALVRSPFGPFALVALVAAASAVGERLIRPSTRTERLLRGVDDLGLAALASVFVRVTIADPCSTEVATRATALVVTVLLFVGLLGARSAAPSSGWSGVLGSVLATALTLGVTYAWLELGPDVPAGTDEQAVAEVVLVCFGLVVVRIASLRAPDRHEPSPEPRTTTAPA